VSQSDTSVHEVLWEGPSEGDRRIPWRGVLRDGRLAPPGNYALVARATRSGSNEPLTERINFQLEHIHAPLEDTLPTFGSGQLLQETIKPSAPWFDLAKGAGMAVAAVALPLVALNSDISWGAHAGAAAAAGIGGAAISFSYRRRNPQIQANVAENNRRRSEREAFNVGVRRRNADRVNQTVMVISPVAGFGR